MFSEAPNPRVLGLELLTEGPNFQILPCTIQPIQRRLAVLLHLHPKLRLKPVRRLVPHEHRDTARPSAPAREWSPPSARSSVSRYAFRLRNELANVAA